MDDELPHPDETARREREWDRTSDPAALWPGLSRVELQRAADAIGDVTATVLDARRASLAPDVGARAIGVAALLAGVGPLLGRWIEDGTLDAREDVAVLLGRHLAHGRERFARVHDGLAAPLGTLAREGVPVTAIKGFHTAQVYFPEPGTRPFADVDLVIATSDIDVAERVLHEAGFSPGPRHEPYKRDWRPTQPESITSFELWHGRARWSIELHDAINFVDLLRYGGRLDVAGGVEPIIMCGTAMQAAAQPLLLAILAVHASLEPDASRLLRLVELVLVIRRDTGRGTLDWPAFLDLLQRSAALRFVYPALVLAERLAPGTVDSGTLATARSATTRRAVAFSTRYTPTAPILRDPLSLDEKLRWAASPRETLRAVRQLVLPTDTSSPLGVLQGIHARIRRGLGKLGTRLASRTTTDRSADP